MLIKQGSIVQLNSGSPNLVVESISIYMTEGNGKYYSISQLPAHINNTELKKYLAEKIDIKIDDLPIEAIQISLDCIWFQGKEPVSDSFDFRLLNLISS
ncbi:hypothetical protein ABEKA_3570 (plasmid) [Acinetobacter lwoffii]|uniref:hypothetical protein n=1 Tax=Acinetobacter lwoffii TaxID=28090 RepID=UPI00191D3FA4|nr:hypothetical protein [Acinetobacter lwoffii]QQA03224.1 hypothetical protein ABEKA_3570 [Acinetobacter lwoffii]